MLGKLLRLLGEQETALSQNARRLQCRFRG